MGNNNIGIRKAFIENKTMEVITEEEYYRRAQFAEPLFGDTCVEMNGMLYPIQQKRFDPSLPGVYDTGCCLKYNKPPKEFEGRYDNSNILVDFANAKDYADVIRMKDSLNRAEIARLTTKDNVYVPVISEEDTPALRLVKEAVGCKEIDLESYRQRMDTDFSNNTRLITSPKNHNITIKKAAALGEAFDFDVELVIRDKKDAINPIGKELRTIITTAGE